MHHSYRQYPRRRFLRAGAAVLALAATAAVGVPGRAQAQPVGSGQPNWRFCTKCYALFYDGYRDKGKCAAGGAHVAQGFEFVLPHDTAETASAQHNWRFCPKCHAMFFDGYPNKGRCPAGGAHVAQGFNFVLPHDQPETPVAQRHWRFCNKCEGMFFNGYPNKGRCPAGGTHVAQGYNFVLPHPVYSCSHCNDGSCQCGYGSEEQMCSAHGGRDPELGCQQMQ